MLNQLIAIAVRRRVATVLLTVAFAAFGIKTFLGLKVEAFPDVTNVQVMVITLYPGQAGEEVERKVTIPVERALTGVPRVLVQRSITSFGLSQVIVTFEDDVDIYWARQQVAERLPEADVPDGIQPHLGPNDTPVGQVFQYTLEGDGYTPSELRGWQDWVVEKALMRTAGVADVVSFGGFQKEYHVLADPVLLRDAQVTLGELFDALKNANGATSGGYVQHGESEFVVRGSGWLKGPKDIENTMVKQRNGTPVLVRNVARVVEGYVPLRGTVGRDKATNSVEGTVLLRRGENPRDVLDALHLRIAQVNKDVLPQGMRIVPFYDRTKLVSTTMHTVSHNMLEGAFLVILVIWIFLRAMRGSIAVAITIPLALLAAFVGLSFAGVPANLLSMGTVDFGILLDGAVILVENAYRHLSHKKPPPDQVAEVVTHAAQEVVRPILFSLSIIICAMLPIFTLERVEGRIFRPVALTYAFALVGALLFTLTTVPAVTAFLLKNQKVEEKEPAFLIFLRTRYLGALRLALKHPLKTRGLGLVVLFIAIALIPRLGTEFLPEMNEGDIHVTITMPSPTSLEEGQKLLRESREILLSFPEVAEVLNEQGHPEDGTDDETPNQAETFVMMKPEEQWGTGRTKEQVVDAMRKAFEARPGVEYNFSQPIKDRVEESISGIRGQIVVKIYGQDLDLMHEKLEDVKQIIQDVHGSRDVEVYRAGTAAHVVADVDRAKAARLGASVNDVLDAIEIGYGGKLATEVWEGERKVGVRVRLPQVPEGDSARIGRLEVPVGDARVPLSALADVHPAVGRTQINREQGGRFLALKCNISGRDMGSFVEEAQSKVERHVKLPPGYYMTWGGEFENQRRAMKRLAVIVPVSVLLIFLLLYMAFGSALPAVVVLLDVPFATVGGVFALFFTHTVLSVSAAVGFITLFGVAVMDGVLLITYVRQARAKYGPESPEAIIDAVSQRMRPVLMTALLASLGLLPAALSHAIGSDTQRPFAIVIIGGLISSTLLTMLLLPTLYDLVDHWFGEGRKIRKAAMAEAADRAKVRGI
ncbi:MAG: CusA/CzcA family heavy metal efflux RND transporter [Myxococcaceae bacterium]